MKNTKERIEMTGHPEQKENEIFLGYMTPDYFHVLPFTNKRMGIISEKYRWKNEKGREIFPIFIEQEEYENFLISHGKEFYDNWKKHLEKSNDNLQSNH